jgi:hypothetical protein
MAAIGRRGAGCVNAFAHDGERRRVCCPGLVVLVLLTTLPVAAQVTVGAGSSLDLANGTIDHGCGNLVVAGTLLLTHGAATGIHSLSIQAGGELSCSKPPPPVISPSRSRSPTVVVRVKLRPRRSVSASH